MNRLDAEQFLAERWQKRCLFLPNSLPTGLPSLDPDELAWLATQPDVESRLVFTERNGGALRYRLEYGPFDEEILTALPPEDWTLLVQDVDKHLPDFRRWFSAVDFVPDWRIDDLMISLAAPGGSVGPHMDNYDVFLCQGDGIREWQLGDASNVVADTESEALSLLRPFDITDSYKASRGDVLYLPPGTPHWGIARDLCMTFSIGMRAPTRRELALGCARLFEEGRDVAETESPEIFYTDPDLGVAEAAPGRIAPEAIVRLRSQSLLDSRLSDAEVAKVLGCVVTDPKAWLMPEPAGDASIAFVLSTLQVHGMARIAWFEDADHRMVFINGTCRDVDETGLDLAQRLASEREISAANFAAARSDPGGPELLGWMFRQGLFDAAHSSE